MAKAANSENIAKEDSNVDYVAAVELITTTVHGIESEQRSLSKDAADAWKRIEDLGVNKEGAKVFSKILKKPVEQRRDEFRTFINLAKAAGWFDWLRDLVDVAEQGPEVQPPQPKAAPGAPAPIKPEAAAPPSDDSDLVDAGTAAAAGKEPAELQTRVDLKRKWVQQVKPASRDKVAFDEDDWEDVREATPAELAAERERLADFSDAVVADTSTIDSAKADAKGKVTGKRRGHLKAVN
jgi:hypothetical protein